MTVRVATVLSARDWEPNLVAHARETAAVRIALRAFQPHEIEDRSADIDVVVAGGEIAWVTPAQIAAWRRAGLGVVGIHPVGDAPAQDLLAAGGAHEILPDDTSVESIVSTVRFLAPRAERRPAEKRATTTAIVGARGAPGCTEIALALAWNRSRHESTLLLDLDLDAPALAIRLGLPPRPDIVDAADAVRADGRTPAETIQRVGKLSVITGSHRPAEPPLRAVMAEDLVDVVSGRFNHVFLDLGGAEADAPLLKRADNAVLVIDSGAVGVVRGAQYMAGWSGPPPDIVVNRVEPRRAADTVEAVRKWIGTDPVAVVPQRPSIRRSALAAGPPDRNLRRMLAGIEETG